MKQQENMKHISIYSWKIWRSYLLSPTHNVMQTLSYIILYSTYNIVI
jgi:hypothetical protein